MKIWIVLLFVLLAGCAQAPKEYAPLNPEDCAIEGLGGVGEVTGGFGSLLAADGSGRGGSLTLRNPSACKGYVNIFARTPNGTVVCVGEWCPDTPPDPPITGTPEALRKAFSPPEEQP